MSRRRDNSDILVPAPSPAKNLHYPNRLKYAQPTSFQLRDGDVMMSF